MKKICTLLLILLFTVNSIVFAQDSKKSDVIMPDAQATLTNEYGEQYTISLASLSHQNNVYSSNSKINEQTYIVDLANAQGSGSNYREEWDKSVSCKAYITIYTTTNTIKGIPCVKLYRVSGGISQVLDRITVTSQKVNYGCSSGDPLVSQTGSKNVSGASFDFLTNFNKYAGTISHNLVGSTYLIDLQSSSGSQWTLEINNIY